ncbi:MAG: FtsK/SpoIIIE domain-containing protein [Acidimicrobiales bacterium]
MVRSERAVETLLSAALRLAWGFRVELGLISAVWIGWDLATSKLGPQLGPLFVVGVVVLILALSWTRHGLWRVLRFARVRRRFQGACRIAPLDREGRQVPMVYRIEDTPAGYRLFVRVSRGTAVADLERVAEVTAAAMAVSKVRVQRDRRNAALARVAVVKRDPLSDPRPLTWPWARAERTSLWDPVPVGLDEDGNTVSLSLPEHNVLLGGEPGAGKSAALSLLLAAAALDPDVTLWLLDGKQVELAPWVSCAQAFVGPDVAQATEVLRSLQVEMDLRYAQLLAWGKRKVAPGDGLGLHVVACDELALYLAAGDRKERTEGAEVLRDLVARGRAAGVIVLAATQKPASDVVPTSLRDLFGFRWALRCATREASDTILGSGWATQGYSAADVDAGARGVGYLLHEGGVPVRLKAAYLDDEAVAALAGPGSCATRRETGDDHRPCRPQGPRPGSGQGRRPGGLRGLASPG